MNIHAKNIIVPIALVGILGLSALQAYAFSGDHSPLTDAQRATIAEMRADGATRTDIKDQLDEWGIEMPMHKHPRAFRHIMSQLTDDQKDTLKELRESGADREAIQAQLDEWGIERPEPPFFSELSDEQKETLKGMHEDGASHEEIHDQLEEWGIDIPERQKNNS